MVIVYSNDIACILEISAQNGSLDLLLTWTPRTNAAGANSLIYHYENWTIQL